MSQLPPGFEVEHPPQPRRSTGAPIPEGFSVDPLASVRQMGVNVTSGWRTAEDQARLKRNGYTPAPNSLHLKGDAIDLTPPKGMGWNDLYSRAQGIAFGWGRGARAIDESRTGKPHVHLQLPGWGGAPTKGNALPPGFQMERPGNLSPTGQVHDGDTFGLSNGQNGRLFGADAFELGQTARSPSGQTIPIGQQARDLLGNFAVPGATVTPQGYSSYNRPVVSLDWNGDAGLSLIRNGDALAAPEFLKSDPIRLKDYMEAERQARLNLLGAHGNTFQTPQSYRQGNPDPWATPETARDGHGVAVFADEPTPFQGLRPEIAQGYLSIWNDPKSTADDLLAYAKTNNFTLNEGDVRKSYTKRFKNGDKPDSTVNYKNLPMPTIDPGDGKVGTTLRGFSDPINMLDEVGAIVDSVGGTDGRENIWNSDRRFGDILWNNIDQNRAILSHDEATHPYYRLGGQLGSGIIMPIGAGARTPLALARIGAIEGGLAGFGAGEGNPLQRMPGAVVGAGLGATGGAVIGNGINLARPVATRLKDRLFPSLGGKIVDDVAGQSAWESAPVVNDGMQSAGPTHAARNQPQGGAMAMNAEPSPSVSARLRDYIDLSPQSQRNLFDRPIAPIEPQDIVPVPRNYVSSFDEAVANKPFSVQPMDVPDEFSALGSRQFPSSGSRPFYQKGPVDLVGFLRSQGGVIDQGGELSALGIDNLPRKMDFSKGEGFLGRLVNPEGMTLDDAAERAWEAGYFPNHIERPGVNELLDAIGETHSGARRSFLPDDLGEIDAFNAARDQRNTIESAAQDGRILSERVGSPVGFDDLPDIPTIAYEDLPAVTGKVGNINLDKIENADDIGRAVAALRDGLGSNPSLARVSHEETAALADQLGMRVEDLLRRRQGQALNHAETFAARNLHAAALKDTVARARQAIGGSDADRAAFVRSLQHTAAIQDHITGATAEAGRTLQQFRMMTEASKRDMAAIKAIVEGAGGHGSVDDMAEAIIDLERDPGAANRFIQNMAKPSWKDKAVELYYNSLLSGPQTHAVNIVSNALTAGLQFPEHLAASAIGQIRRGSVDRVMASELGPRIVGMMQGALEGLKAARRTFKTGDVPDFTSKVESATQEAIGGLKGHIIRTPTRALSAEDEFFKAIARRSEIAGLAVRKAKGEGLSGEAFSNRVAELTANPTDEMVRHSLDYARYVTFQRPVGPVAGAVLRATQKAPILKAIVPFVRTPTNILKFALERSPAAPVLKEWRADFMAGGARRDLATARMTLGTGLGAVVAELAASGYITGSGPADENAKRLLVADDWQPYSIKIGDNYYSYQRLDPLATTLGVAADYVGLQDQMTERQHDQVAELITASIMSNLSDKTWLSGMSDFVNAIHDPMRYGQSWINRMGGQLVPTGVAQLARTVDNTPRESKNIPETLQSRIPWASEGLRPRLDAWGNPIEKEGGVGPDIVSPVYTSTRQNDPVNAEALRLNLRVSDPSRIVGGKRLSDAEFHQYRMQSAQLTRLRLAALMTSPDWQAMNDDQRVKAFEKIKRDARAEVRGGGVAPALPPPPQGNGLPAGFVVER